jgi:hypothetical protein
MFSCQTKHVLGIHMYMYIHSIYSSVCLCHSPQKFEMILTDHAFNFNLAANLEPFSNPLHTARKGKQIIEVFLPNQECHGYSYVYSLLFSVCHPGQKLRRKIMWRKSNLAIGQKEGWKEGKSWSEVAKPSMSWAFISIFIVVFSLSFCPKRKIMHSTLS